MVNFVCACAKKKIFSGVIWQCIWVYELRCSEMKRFTVWKIRTVTLKQEIYVWRNVWVKCLKCTIRQYTHLGPSVLRICDSVDRRLVAWQMNALRGVDLVPIVTNCAVLDTLQTATTHCNTNWNIIHRSESKGWGLDKEFVSPPCY
jgi:hypothetical protein